MPGKKFYADVADATVVFTRKICQGVLANNNMIVTAAHCIDCNCDGSMPQGRYVLEEVETKTENFKVAPLFVDPINDVAVLGEAGEEAGFKEARKFQRFCSNTRPVPVFRGGFEILKAFNVHVLTHKNKWVKGTALQYSPNDISFFIDTEERIEGGTSGGPIVNDSGELIGIASIGSSGGGESNNGLRIPHLHLTLPVWVCREIFEDYSE